MRPDSRADAPGPPGPLYSGVRCTAILPGSNRQDLLAAAALGVVVLALYVSCLHPSLPGGDSGELITVVATGGVAHPPGYPLYTLLGQLWLAILPGLPPAPALNLLSALTMALAVAGVFRILRRLGIDQAPAVAGAAAFALIPPVFTNALVAEVFALNALIAALLLDGAIRLMRGDPRGLRPVLLSTGLLVGHHHSLLILSLPVLTVVAVRGRRVSGVVELRNLAVAGGWFVAGLLPLLYLPVAAAGHPPLDWGHPVRLVRFFDLLLRREYGTFSLASEESGHVAERSHVLVFFSSAWRDLGPAGVALIVAGLARLRRHPGLATVLGGALLLQLVFLTRVTFPTTPPVYRGVVERFYVLPYLLLSVPLALGFQAMIDRIGTTSVRRAATVTLTLLLLIPLATRIPRLSQSGNTFVADFAHNLLVSLPPGAIVLSRGDLNHNSLVYLLEVERRRPDVVLCDQELMTRDWYLDHLRHRHPDLANVFPESRYTGTGDSRNRIWVDRLIDRRPIVFLGAKETSYAEKYDLIPLGLFEYVVRRGTVPSWRDQALQGLEWVGQARLDSYFRGQEPTSFEHGARPRLAAAIERLCRVLCQPEVRGMDATVSSGFLPLQNFLDRHGRLAQPDPALLRGGGLLRLGHPAFFDTSSGRRDLEEAVRLEPVGPGADEARRVLAVLSLRGAEERAGKPVMR